MNSNVDCEPGNEDITNYLLGHCASYDVSETIHSVDNQNAAYLVEYFKRLDERFCERRPLDKIDV